MKLKELQKIIPQATLFGDGETIITGLHYNSQKLNPGDLFVAIKGFKTDGHQYIPQAQLKGSKAIIVDQKGAYSLPGLLVPDSRIALALISRHFFNYPLEKIPVIGITGTNGKTTTAFMLESILKSAGFNPMLIGTIYWRIGKKQFNATHTTPESYDLFKFVAENFIEKPTHLILEVSSHALALKRVAGIKFAGAIFTNITSEHGEFHRSFTEYFNVKKSLFKDYLAAEGLAVINDDDQASADIIKESKGKIITYALKKKGRVKGKVIENSTEGLLLNFELTQSSMLVKCNLRGEFNAYNALAAAAMAEGLNIDPLMIKKGLEQLQEVKGRFQKVPHQHDFTVIVDYAHSPDGLENLLKNAAKMTENRLIVVFGCGGDRDKEKRPLMGQIAALYSDYIILTDDNPRFEKSEDIVQQIAKGIANQKPYQIIIRRREAIKAALTLAKTGDFVIIAGKGHESGQEQNGLRSEFDDYEVAKQILLQKRGGGI